MVDWVPKAFVKSGLIWLSGGVTLGLVMAIQPAWIIYRPAHVHMNLLGFVAMIIFGVGYQILPRMMGYGLWSRNLALAHWWMANTGLAGMVAGFFLRPHQPGIGTGVLIAGGILETLGAYAFAFNILRSMRAPAEIRARAPAARPLPVAADG